MSQPLTMPFGRHKGTPLAEVPIAYLRWVSLRYLQAGLELRQACRAEYRRRHPKK